MTEQEAVRATQRLVALLDSQLFAALADPTRIALIKVLLLHGPADIGTIASHLPQDRSVISRHLKTMLEAELVAVSADRRRRIYQLNGMTLIDKLDSIVQEARRAVFACCPPAK